MNKNIIKVIIFAILMCWGLPGGTSHAQAPKAAKKVVFIDAAHGGADLGVKVSDKMSEKELTLKFALLVQKELGKDDGIQVVLSRDKDTDLAIAERIKRIEAARPLAAVSLHVNAGFDKKAKGFEVYFPGFKGAKAGKDESAAIISDMKKNKHLNDSVRLARSIQKQLETVFPRENRGLREAPLPILEGVSVPAVVVEIGFAGNPDNFKKLTNDKYQQDIARAIAKGVRESL